ncbi:hypothetical protein BHE74_00009177 [Ensete ventricosum]|nr:hypothetical protein BHE74_00009177 [Ensete ventricosum]
MFQICFSKASCVLCHMFFVLQVCTWKIIDKCIMLYNLCKDNFWEASFVLHDLPRSLYFTYCCKTCWMFHWMHFHNVLCA